MLSERMLLMRLNSPVKALIGGVMMNDSELIELIKKSPDEAFGEIIGQYGSLVYAIAANKLHLCASSEDIEDCVSDIFVEVFRNLSSLSAEKGSLKAFISTVAKRSAIDAYRRISYRQRVTESIDREGFAMPSSDENVEEAAVDRVCSSNIRDIIMSLGEPDSSIIIHQYYYNHTIRETAKALSMSVGAVQQRSLRARKRIEKLLDEKG